MNCSSAKWFSLAELLQFRIFDTVYARPTRQPCDDADSDGSKEAASGGKACGGGGGGGGDGPPKHRGYVRREQVGRVERAPRRCGGARARADAAPAPHGASDGETLPGGVNFPGLLRHVCHNAHCVVPLCFEGLLLSVRQTPTANWTAEHTMAFSQICPAGYRLMLAYSGTEAELRMPYALVEVSPSGYVTLEGRAAPTGGSRAALMGQLAKGEVANWECTLDAYSNSGTASLLTLNREMITLHLFQAVTQSVAVGAEAVAWGARSSAAGALRWRSAAAARGAGGHYASLFAGTRGLDLCYSHLVLPQLTVAAKLEVGFVGRRCVATLAHEYRGGAAGEGAAGGAWTARGSLDSDGLVGGTLERAVGASSRAALSVALSALYNLTNDKFGLGFRCTASLL